MNSILISKVIVAFDKKPQFSQTEASLNKESSTNNESSAQ